MYYDFKDNIFQVSTSEIDSQGVRVKDQVLRDSKTHNFLFFNWGSYFFLAYNMAPGTWPHLLFYDPMYHNYFLTAPDFQNYYFLVLLVENISLISLLPKFILQLNNDKIYTWSFNKIWYFEIKCNARKLSFNKNKK